MNNNSEKIKNNFYDIKIIREEVDTYVKKVNKTQKEFNKIFKDVNLGGYKEDYQNGTESMLDILTNLDMEYLIDE